MPLWVAFALAGALMTGIGSVIDKYVLSKWMPDAIGSFFVFGVFECVVGLIAFLALGAPILPLGTALFAIGTGTIISLSVYFYFRALKVGEVSRLVPLYDLSPILIAVFAAIFLGEVFAPVKYLGILLLIIGSLLLSVRRLRGWHLGPGVGWMLLAVAIIALGGIGEKYLLAGLTPWTLFAYGKLGAGLVVLPFARRGYPVFRKAVHRHGAPVVLFMSLSEVLSSATTIFFLYAVSTSYVTLVSAILNTHAFFTLVVTILLSVFRPKVLKEEFGGGLLWRKAAAMALMFVGAWLVT